MILEDLQNFGGGGVSPLGAPLRGSKPGHQPYSHNCLVKRAGRGRPHRLSQWNATCVCVWGPRKVELTATGRHFKTHMKPRVCYWKALSVTEITLRRWHVNYWVRSTAGMTLQGETYIISASSLAHLQTARHKYCNEWRQIEDGPPREEASSMAQPQRTTVLFVLYTGKNNCVRLWRGEKNTRNCVQYFLTVVLFTFCTFCILRCFVCIVVSCLVCIVVVLCVFVVLCVHCCFHFRCRTAAGYVSIRKVLRPATSTQVFLGFPVSISKCWDGSQDSKLPLHASHVAHPT